MYMMYTYQGRKCHIAYEYAGGLVAIRFGTRSAWQGEIIVPFVDLEAIV